MTTAALSLMIFGLLLTWGGAAFCIYTAMKKSRPKNKRPSRGEDVGEGNLRSA